MPKPILQNAIDAAVAAAIKPYEDRLAALEAQKPSGDLVTKADLPGAIQEALLESLGGPQAGRGATKAVKAPRPVGLRGKAEPRKLIGPCPRQPHKYACPSARCFAADKAARS